MTALTADLRQSVRALRARPAFTAFVVLTLALGIGANTAIFSVVRAVLLQPLPFREPERLVHVFESRPARDRYQPGSERGFISVRAGTFHDWQAQARSFERMAAVRLSQAALTGRGEAAVAEAQLAGEGLFETLGVPPLHGRVFSADDYADAGRRVVVLSHRLWQERFGADRSLVGRDIEVDGAAHRVIGVMPAGFYPTRWYTPELWLPLRWEPATRHSRVLWGLIVFARLKPGVAFEHAVAEMDVVGDRIRAAHPDHYDDMGAVLAPVTDYLVSHHGRTFYILLGAVALVLLVACANVANLLLSRALEREREFAVRKALGASRGRLLGQVLAESLLLAGVGGLLGLALAPLLTQPVLALLPEASRLPRLDEVHLDGQILLFTLGVSVLTGLLFGVVPAWRAASVVDLQGSLQEGGRSGGPGLRSRRLSDALVVGEVALSVVLVVFGGLLLQAFAALLRTDPGLQPDRALALSVSVPAHRYGEYKVGGANEPRARLFERLEQVAGGVPGVSAAAVMAQLPLRHGPNPWGISIEGRPAPPTGAADGGTAVNRITGLPNHGSVSIQRVTPGYFAALGIPLRRGRLFDARDRPGAPMPALINETAAKKFFPDEDPVGKRITVDMTSYFPKVTIVGVVGDSRMNGLDQEVYPQVFWPMAYLPGSNGWLVVRTHGDPAVLAGALRRELARLDPELAVTEVHTMASVLAESLWRQRLSAVLVGLFAGLATLLAMAGLYAVVAYAVARRTREFGVRAALGATSGDLARLVTASGLRLVGVGVALGTGLALALQRVLGSQWREAGTVRPELLAGAAAALVLLALAACWLPAWRASRVAPVVALRQG